MAAAVPGDNEEFIFNSRPASHYRITQTQLNKWYVRLFREAKNQGVVYGVTYDESPDLPENLSEPVSFYINITSDIVCLMCFQVIPHISECILNYDFMFYY